jgi:hypothetical protein
LIKSAISLLGLVVDKRGFLPKAIMSQLLQTGGAMAMYLNNINRDKIRKQGWWSSDTFLIYIHEQISAFFKIGFVTMKLLTRIGWHNIDGPTLTMKPAAAA